ncbi:MAG: dicarboxylate/amino acid:cation symporter [Gemmatimonadaceae bacterium]
MSLTARVLLALVAGFALGLVISRYPDTPLAGAVSWVEPLGALFINAIRMTVIPLVVSSLIVAVAAAPDAKSIARVGWRALLIFIVVLFAAGSFTAVVGQPLLGRVPVDPAAAGAFRSAVATADGMPAANLPTLGDWLVGLIPANPIRAAADGAMLPLIIFTLAFAVALLRLGAERRARVSEFFQGVFDAMLVLVRWVLALAPIGVFALAVPLTARMGFSAAGAMASYVVLVVVLSVAFGALLYPAAALLGRVSIREFARAAAPAQAVAFSARSSLASLPAMMERGAERLRFPPQVTSFLLPLAASTFRPGAGVGLTIGVLFVARLYGVTLSVAQVATIVLTVVLTSFSVPGIPNGSILVMVPVMMAAGIPVEGATLLLALDTVPDMFRTTLNVTGHMTVATIVARGERVRAGAEEATHAGAADVQAADVT